MMKKAIALCLCLLVTAEAFAFDSDKFYKAIETYAKLSNHADVLLKEAKETWKFDAYEKAMDRADAAANVVVRMVNRLRKDKDIEAATITVNKFEKASAENEQAAKFAKKLLSDRSKFLDSHSIFNLFKRDSKKTTAK